MASLRERIADAIGGDRPDHRWGDRVDELLYEGESVRDRVDVDGAQVVVTSHRVLAFTPDRDGATFQQVERPNVRGVSTGAAADGAMLVRGVRWSLIGLVTVGAGLLVDFDAIVGDVTLGGPEASRIGIGGVLSAVSSLLDLLRQLDQILQLFGALALLLGVAIFGVYLHGRTPTLTVDVDGDEDVHLPRPEDSRTTIDRLEGAIFPDDGPGESTVPGVGPPDGTGDRDRDPLGEA